MDQEKKKAYARLFILNWLFFTDIEYTLQVDILKSMNGVATRGSIRLADHSITTRITNTTTLQKEREQKIKYLVILKVSIKEFAVSES